ncbi:MAG: HD domain-containing protein, partial [Nitrospirae bacterium]|nr:HD domain-containing protein [Nitrospirota bacterium]
VLARIANLLKVKQLNDALKAAYSNINSLTVAGGSLIKSVNTLNFRFMPVLDMMVEQIVRKSDKMYDKPLIILVRVIEDKKNYKWYRYGYTNKIQRHPFVLDAGFMTEETESSSIFYSNNPAQENIFAPLAENLKRYNISVENLICYLSDALVIVALNYGRDVTIYDAAVLETLVVQTLFMRSLSVQIKETEKSFEYTVHALARASEANDDDTGNHIYRVGEYCALLAKKMNMPDSFVKDIRLQATLHDVGKIHVHPDILRKPVALTQEQWAEMKQHPVFAANIIGNHKRLELARVIAMTHHEKWDGSGYPYGLARESIHIGGRITAIADCYDALRNRRGYKPCFDHTTTFKIITEGDNRTKPNHFDPNILAVFKEIASMFEDVYERLKNK